MRSAAVLVLFVIALVSFAQDVRGASTDRIITLSSPRGEIHISGKTDPLVPLTDLVWEKRSVFGIPEDAVRCSEHVFGTWLVLSGRISLQLGIIAAPKGEKPNRRDILLHLWPTDNVSEQNRWIKQRAPGAGVATVNIQGRIPIIGSVAILEFEESKEVLRCISGYERIPFVITPVPRRNRDA